MSRKDPAVRCEMRTNYGVKGRCRCRIGQKHGLLMDALRLNRLYCCDNHWRALRRGSTVTDIHGRRWKWDESAGLQEVKDDPVTTSLTTKERLPT
jgi:hypothetical protein